MLRYMTIFTIGVTMGFVGAGHAFADTMSVTDYFNADKSCFARQYSQAHMAAHPKQKVDYILLNHATAPQEKAWFGEIPLERPARVLRLLVHVKGQPQNWEEFAGCELEGRAVNCSMECDAGQFSVTIRDDGKLLLKPAGEMWFTDCDAGDALLDPEPDDKLFLLEPQPISECLPPKYQ